MTETLQQHDPAHQAMAFLGAARRWIGRVGFGLLVGVALLIAVIATTFVGFLLAGAALFLSLGRWGRKAAPKAAMRADRQSAPDDVLEARPTADGWVIEPR
ncbi:MAG: hypothetical protein R3C52_11795 [Hyphomonadaceae bacterium]